MSKYYILKRPDAQQAQDQISLMFYLHKVNPAIMVQPALIVTVPDELDCLMRSIDGIPMISPAPAVVQAAVVQMAAAIPMSEKPVKKYRRRPAMMTCSQCHKERERTKTGICKPCAMNNARQERKNGREIPAGHVGAEERKVNASARVEEHLITRHGPIKARKLG